MNMSLNSLYLDAFYACAQLEHFTRAAERLHITQSALSQRIKNLEEELGSTLIIRSRTGLRLTEFGHELLRYCHSKERLESEILGRVQGRAHKDLRGVIRIGGFSSVVRSVVMPALKNLLAANPELELKTLTGELYELPGLLKSGEIDFMVIDETLTQDGLAHHVLGHEQNVLVQKKGYRGPEVYLDHDENDRITVRYLKRKSAAGLKRRYLDDVYGLMDGVRLGFGRAVLPLHLIEGHSDLQVVEPDRILTIPIVLHHYEQPFYSRLHKSVVDSLKNHAPEILD